MFGKLPHARRVESRRDHRIRSSRRLFLESLENRQLLAAFTPGNILVSSAPFDQPAMLLEYTPTGELVQSVVVPHPTNSNIDKARDIVVDRSGKVEIYNGSYNPRLTTFDPVSGSFSHTNFPTWDTSSHVTYGGIAALNEFVFTTDQQVRGEPDSSRGLVRFNVENLNSGWTLNPAPDIGDSIVNTSTFIPHLTVHGTGNGSVDYYSFTVSQVPARGIFDIDRGDTGTTDGFRSGLRLFNSEGVLLAQNNGDVPINVGGLGSTGTGDAYLEYEFSKLGDYRIQVGSCCPFAGVPVGSSYDLQLSLEHHSLFIPAGNGELNEVEPNDTFFTPQNTDSAERFASADGSVLDVAVGLDGLVYTLIYSNSPTSGGNVVNVYDPGTLQRLRTMTLVGEHRAIAVDASGLLYAANPGLARYDASGNLLYQISSPITGILADLDIRSDGTLLVASNTGNIALTNTQLDGVDFFSARPSNGTTFAAFVQDPTRVPRATDDIFRVAEDTNNSILSVLINDLVDSRGLLVIESLSTPDHGGSVSIVGGRSVRYTPAADFVGTESFHYTVRDGLGSFATGRVQVLVSNVNEPPVANGDSFSVLEDSAAMTFSVLENDSFAPDIDEVLTITEVSAGSNGAELKIVDDGTRVSYRPRANFAGLDKFTYTISDGNGGRAEGTVTVSVVNTNDNPTAVADNLNVLPGSVNNGLNVLANDSAAPDSGETLTIIQVTTPLHGTAKIDKNRIAYTPTAGYIGTDSFTYRISDGNGGFAEARANLTVDLINNPPVADDDVFNVRINSSGHNFAVLKNDSTEPDANETLTITDVTVPSANGVVEIVNNSVLRYSPAIAFAGLETFQYTVTDGRGGASSATVFVNVGDFNSDPAANDDNIVVRQNVVQLQLDVLANDRDPDGDTIRISEAPGTSLRGGSVAITEDGGALLYTAPSPFLGSDVVTYTISDGLGGKGSATVAIRVIGWQNPINPLDVNGDTCVSAIDVSILINELNRPFITDGRGNLPTPPPVVTTFYDVSGEGFLTALDPLKIINELNRNRSTCGPNLGSGGEGESFVAPVATPSVSSRSPSVPDIGVAKSWNPQRKTGPLADYVLPQLSNPTTRSIAVPAVNPQLDAALNDVIDALARDLLTHRRKNRG